MLCWSERCVAHCLLHISIKKKKKKICVILNLQLKHVSLDVHSPDKPLCPSVFRATCERGEHPRSIPSPRRPRPPPSDGLWRRRGALLGMQAEFGRTGARECIQEHWLEPQGRYAGRVEAPRRRTHDQRRDPQRLQRRPPAHAHGGVRDDAHRRDPESSANGRHVNRHSDRPRERVPRHCPPPRRARARPHRCGPRRGAGASGRGVAARSVRELQRERICVEVPCLKLKGENRLMSGISDGGH
ncbi:hypothetical protein T492DRAFT_106925 [Pavlovales sp. CCMP2436]|nr:hypothetical protein T492DRAFT_106925 [Pavlovales sp. CCMP2436]